MTTANDDLLKRITARPDVFNGKPIIRDMRISVELVLSLMSQGASHEELKDDYPDLEEEDILACIAYAHAVIAETPWHRYRWDRNELPRGPLHRAQADTVASGTGTRRPGRERTRPRPPETGYSWNGPSPKTGSSSPWTRISVNSSTSTEDRTRG